MAIDNAALNRLHPTYTTLFDTWTLLQQAYRGDGGFLDGDNLVPHPREIIYARNADGSPNTDTVLGYRDKYKRRQSLARYENFARTIVDTFIAHLFSKPVVRKCEAWPELTQWWENVDGAGAHIDEWMHQEAALAFVYGQVVVLMDRLQPPGQPARTRAEQGAPVLRAYGPLDVPDWIWREGRYRAIKLLDTVSRQDILNTDDDGEDTFLVYDEQQYQRYNDDGSVIDQGQHGFGVVPAEIHRARLVPGMPDCGASVLGDPKLFKDHFNLLSELREMLRGQVFSMLNIQLGQDEDVSQARGRLGDYASVETVVFSRGTAGFIQPDKGPAEVYEAELQALERKIYRLAGLPFEGDSRDAESADSRRLKAMDLQRLLAMYADECERVEYALAKLWFRATSGTTDTSAVDEAVAENVQIHYPDEFSTLDVAQAAQDVRDVASMQLGMTATKEYRKRAVRVVLTDADEEMLTTIDDEIDAAAKQAQQQPQQASSAFRARVTAAAPVEPMLPTSGQPEATGTVQ